MVSPRNPLSPRVFSGKFRHCEEKHLSDISLATLLYARAGTPKALTNLGIVLYEQRQARALLYGADPQIRGSSFTPSDFDFGKLIEIAFKQYVALEGKACVKPTESVKDLLNNINEEKTERARLKDTIYTYYQENA